MVVEKSAVERRPRLESGMALLVVVVPCGCGAAAGPVPTSVPVPVLVAPLVLASVITGARRES